MKFVAATLIALVFCGTAQAAINLDAAMGTARNYWAVQGVAAPCEPTWTVAPVAGPFAGGGYGTPCAVQFDPAVFDYARRDACLLALHEYGHALGLTHDDVDRYPIMVGGQATYAVHTPFCDGAAKIGRLSFGHHKTTRRHIKLGGRIEYARVAHRVRVVP